MTEQEKRIIADRKSTGVSEVDLHHVPNWFRLKLLKAFGCENGCTRGEWVLHHAVRRAGGDNGTMDHWGSTTIRGRRAFVNEPYHISPKNLTAMRLIAHAIGCELSIEQNSWWFPGSTMRIAIIEGQT